MQKFLVFLVCVFLILPFAVFTKTGVGIGTGKIELTESLKSGAIYDLPSLTIFNTGDEPSGYTMNVAYQQGQENKGQYRPAQEWFIFEPLSFNLEPRDAQEVKVQMTLPLKTIPGNYFCYLEGKTIHTGTSGGARIGVAAGAQLYFTIAPANIFQAIYYRTAALFKKYSPWSRVGLWLVVAAIVIIIFRTLFRKFFKLQIGISRKQETKNKEQGMESKVQKTISRKQKRISRRHQK